MYIEMIRWFVVGLCLPEFFWLLCYVTLRQEHMYEHIEVPTVFFVLFIPLPLITAKPWSLMSGPLPYSIRDTQTSKRKFIFALVIAVLPNLDEHQLHYLPSSSNSGTPLSPPPSLFPPLLPTLTPPLSKQTKCVQKVPPSSHRLALPPYYLPYTWIQKEPRKGHQFCTWEAFKYVARSWSAQLPSHLGRLKLAK
jgi:hypothetical protein